MQQIINYIINYNYNCACGMHEFTELLPDLPGNAVIGAISRYKIRDTVTQIHGLCPTNLQSANENQSES